MAGKNTVLPFVIYPFPINTRRSSNQAQSALRIACVDHSHLFIPAPLDLPPIPQPDRQHYLFHLSELPLVLFVFTPELGKYG